MSNNKLNPFERLFKLQATVGKLVLDGKRDPESVASVLQKIVNGNPFDTIVVTDKRFEQVGEFSVVVPEDYDHATRLAKFSDEYRKELNYYSDAITDENYSRATTKLVPGLKFKVKIFQIKEAVTSMDCLEFLKNQRAVLVGAQGASLAYEQGKSELPVNRWSVSFDEKNTLWQGTDGRHGVPCVRRFSADGFGFGLGFFNNDWNFISCLLCFCDE